MNESDNRIVRSSGGGVDVPRPDKDWSGERGGAPPLQSVQGVAGVVCPCCGYIAGAKPVVDLATNVITYGGMSSWLSPTQAVLTHTLAQKWMKIVPTMELRIAMYGAAKARANSRDSLRHTATTLRARLGSLRLGLVAVQGLGYKLVPIPAEEGRLHIQRGRERRRRYREAEALRKVEKRKVHLSRNYIDD